MKANEALRRDVDRELSRLGYDMVQIEFAGTAARPVLRLRVERSSLDRPVGLGDCASVSRRLERWLEEGARVPERYVLEVSSPGLERPLTRDRDFERFSGRRVEVKATFDDGVARRRGRLLGLVGETGRAGSETAIRLRLDGGAEVEVPRSRVEAARLVHDWGDAR